MNKYEVQAELKKIRLLIINYEREIGKSLLRIYNLIKEVEEKINDD